VIAVLSVVISGLVIGLLYSSSNKTPINQAAPTKTQTHPTQVPTTLTVSHPTQTTTAQNPVGYTAQDVLHDFINAGASVYQPQNNETIWTWSGSTFYVKEQALSSVSFGDIAGCTGGCTPGQVGLWVYESSDIAINVQDEVIQDEANGNVMGPIGYINPYVSGRCVLLTNVTDSIYKQIAQEYCH
jgi:hypothetical protein